MSCSGDEHDLLGFFPTQKINGFFSQIQESRISEDDARERGLGLFEKQ